MSQRHTTTKLKVLREIARGCVLGASLISAGAAWADCPDDYQKARAGDYDIKGPEVLDKKTGLTWQRCGLGQTYEEGRGCTGSPKVMNFEQAKTAAANGWRLPSKEELERMRMDGCSFPAVNTILYLSLEGRRYWYWSSTDQAADKAWALNPEGGIITGTPKTDLAAVILVK